MTVATLVHPDGRSHDLVTLPRAATEEAWIDVQATAWEARRDIGSAYQASRAGRSPAPRLMAADGRLLRLQNYARQRAAEAAGITYISPGQMPLPDGCFDPDDRSA
jgi:hypothetical protein